MGGHLEEVRKIREARERAARRALRGLDPEQGSEGEEESDDADLPEAPDLTPEDERRALAPHTGASKPPQPAVHNGPSPAALPVIRLGWAAEAATPGLPAGSPGEAADVFCVRYSPDDALVAAGCGDGVVRVYHATDGRLAYSLADDSLTLPTTCLRFRPSAASAKTRNVLLAANSDGTVKHWHLTSGKCLHSVTEQDNQVYAVDYDTDGSHFATAGRDCHIRLYDETTKSAVSTLLSSLDRAPSGYHSAGASAHSGHSNRVFGLRFGAEPHSLLSGGWDNTVQLWDTRTATTALSIYGPHVCGDALDMRGHTILSGSWRPEQQLQLWDARTGGLLATLPWPAHGRTREPCQVYAAQFSRHDGGARIIAGGSGANEVRVFDAKGGGSLAAITLPKGVYGLDVEGGGGHVAVAAGDNAVRTLELPC
ncbi:hypothetical protein EMIHUDRAFT_99388 [Emiliania huxleyi CCMP1516]|uniref:Anaphase-promoting complex subunit 4 WD40 domain-containing protein n=2 Tax=Emiliania huxleyi TaxID=2903 RepID=A0A0D3K5Y4_EMIH1|nr:hypothetical protein EMIHUDRAFT_99388 [Emiliania huxleyi CCMP1516]EOD31169.1 hypothetical protein EMIHUDRAFT_99388 [Emiliania huxleyi CCMP1516]|eukprot:XP_005783598.1 hypothetical protein EMIHUDRAFT_99388 [Emiliania huxleyi CCMP1516]